MNADSLTKKMIPFLFLIGLAPGVAAQTKTADYYIHLIATGNSSGFLTSYPTLETAMKDRALDTLVHHSETKAVLRKGNVLDALNYLSRAGWKLVSVTSVPHGSLSMTDSRADVETRCYYLLKKEIRLE